MDSSLANFLTLNPTVEKVEETEHINLEKLWSDDTFMCRFNKNTDFSALINVQLPSELTAIFHKADNRLEYIYAPLQKNYKFIANKFKIIYANVEFSCTFGPPSATLVMLAKSFKALDITSDTKFRNLQPFFDFYMYDTLEKSRQEYFSDKIPISFFLDGDFSKINFDFVSLSKHINVYLRYFDRLAPNILIFNKDFDKEKFTLPCYSKSSSFPEIISTQKIDPVILDLMHISFETNNIRLKYLFNFQILEYCSYYHLNDDLKRKLGNIVRNPDILNNPEQYSQLIVEEFKNHFKSNDDKQKLEKLVVDYCEYKDILLEIKSNAKYFCKDLEFDGGFKVQALFNKEEEIDNEPKDIMKSIVDKIDKIRNVLVHIRESRENKVILPTSRNHHQLIPYYYLIRRIAEKVAIRYRL